MTSCQAEQKTVRLAFLGDTMPGREVTLNEDSLQYLAASIQTADLAMANLESPLSTASPPTTDGYKLCASPENARILAGAGLDLLSMVNNHNLDCGSRGTTDTAEALAVNHLVGLDQNGYTTTLNGNQLTFFAFEDISSPLDVTAATQAIQAARAEGSMVIVSVHWGMEYQGGASDRQKELAEKWSAAGATVIWGHHPHVLQPAEWMPAGCLERQEKSGCTLVLYSLGNALFDQAGLLDTRRSALVSVVLNQDGILSTEVMPFVIDPVHSLLIAPDENTSALITRRLQLP